MNGGYGDWFVVVLFLSDLSDQSDSSDLSDSQYFEQLLEAVDAA